MTTTHGRRLVRSRSRSEPRSAAGVATREARPADELIDAADKTRRLCPLSRSADAPYAPAGDRTALNGRVPLFAACADEKSPGEGRLRVPNGARAAPQQCLTLLARR